MTNTALSFTPLRNCLLARGCRVVGEFIAVAAKVTGADIASKAILLHMPDLRLRQWMPVWRVQMELTVLHVRIHALKNISASQIGETDEFRVIVD